MLTTAEGSRGRFGPTCLKSEEEDIFVSRQLYNMVNILSLSSGLARPRDVVGALLQSTFKDYTQCSRIS